MFLLFAVQQKSSREDAEEVCFFFTHTWWAAEGVSPAAEMAITHLKMDFRLSEMRPLSLMRRQITAAKVVDGDQMEAKGAGVAPRGW